MIIKYKHHFLRYLPHSVVKVQELGSSCCCSNVGRFVSTAAAACEVVANDDGSGSSNNNNNKRRGVKMSKQERKSMVSDFVNKYRLMNAGKFPTAKYTKGQVGGSYYTVRSILQELQYDSKLSEVTVTDKATKVGKNNKVNGISDVSSSVDSVVSPRISGEDDISSQGGFAEKRKAPDNEASARTATDMSIPLETISETSVLEKISKVIKVSEPREILDSDVPLRGAVVATDHVISSGDFANDEIVSLKVKEDPFHEVPEMVDVVNECRISSAEDSSSSVTDPTVATTDINLLFKQTDTESVRGVLDTEVHVNIKQVVVDSSSCQNMMVDDVSDSGTSVDLNLREERKMSTSDVVKGDNYEYLDSTQMLGTRKSDQATLDQAVKATTAAPEYRSKPDHPESLSSSRSTELPEMDNSSSPASTSHLSTSDSMEKTEEKRSLWGNLKSFASGFINIWRKS